ncbi:MAG: phosphoribosylamine--glycine ligase, partial [Pseudomonadota bacterium]
TVTDAQARAYELLKQVSWKDAYFRTDIAYRAIAREKA